MRAHQTETFGTTSLGTVMRRIPEAFPITCHQVGSAPYKEWKTFFTTFPKTTYQIQFHGQSLYCICPRALKNRKKPSTETPTEAASLCTLPFSMLLLRSSYFVIKPTSKDLLAKSSTMKIEECLFASGWLDCKECDTLMGWEVDSCVCKRGCLFA